MQIEINKDQAGLLEAMIQDRMSTTRDRLGKLAGNKKLGPEELSRRTGLHLRDMQALRTLLVQVLSVSAE